MCTTIDQRILWTKWSQLARKVYLCLSSKTFHSWTSVKLHPAQISTKQTIAAETQAKRMMISPQWPGLVGGEIMHSCPHHWSSHTRLLHMGGLNTATNEGDVPLNLFLPGAEQYRGKNPGSLAGLQRSSVFPFVLRRSCQEVFAQSVQWAHSYLGYYLCKQPQCLQGILSRPTLICSCCFVRGLSQRYPKICMQTLWWH